MSKEGRFSASNYRSHKAKRLAEVKPEWVQNPDTDQWFLLRRVGAMASMIANHMPTVTSLTDEVVAKWQEAGIDLGESSVNRPVITAEKIAEGERDLKMMARVVGQACVIPRLVTGATAEDELDPAEMEDSDVLFIFRWATGQLGALKGGGVINMADAKSLVKRPGRRVRVGANAKEQRDASEQTSRAS